MQYACEKTLTFSNFFVLYTYSHRKMQNNSSFFLNEGLIINQNFGWYDSSLGYAYKHYISILSLFTYVYRNYFFLTLNILWKILWKIYKFDKLWVQKDESRLQYGLPFSKLLMKMVLSKYWPAICKSTCDTVTEVHQSMSCKTIFSPMRRMTS